MAGQASGAGREQADARNLEITPPDHGFATEHLYKEVCASCMGAHALGQCRMWAAGSALRSNVRGMKHAEARGGLRG